MNEKSFFLNTNGELIRKVEIEVIQTFYNMTKDSSSKFRDIKPSEKSELLSLQEQNLTFETLVDLLGIQYDKSTKEGKSRFSPQDRMTLLPGEWFNNKEKIDTTVGRFLFNKILVEKPGFQNIFPFINYELTEGKFFGTFEKKIANSLLLDKVTVDQMYVYIDTRDWLGMQMHGLITPSFTASTFSIHPEVQKLKNELFKKYKDELDNGNAVIAADIEKELIAKTKEVFKDDPGLDLYNSGARGSIGNNYKNMFLMRGAVYNRAKKKYEIVKNSLTDGLRIDDIPVSSNTILEGAYPKACGTRESGYMAKKLLASCQSEILGEPGSDCGTKRGISQKITKENADKYLYRYIFDGGETILLTPENITKYVDTVVELRSPMGCIRTKDGCICNKCGGEFYYMVGNTSIGLSASKIGNSLTRLNMKKFHENIIKFTKVDINDMFF